MSLTAHLEKALENTVFESSEDLKKTCATYPGYDEKVHFKCSTLESFQTFPGLSYGIAEGTGMMVGRPIHAVLKQGFDIRASLKMTFENLKHFQEIFYNLVDVMINGKEALITKENEVGNNPEYIITDNYNGFRFGAKLRLDSDDSPQVWFGTQFNPCMIEKSKEKAKNTSNFNRSMVNPKTAKWRWQSHEKRFGFILSTPESFVEFLDKLTINHLGLHVKDATIIQAFINVFESLASTAWEAERNEGDSIVGKWKIVEDLVESYKDQNYYKDSDHQSVFKIVQQKTKFPLRAVKQTFLRRNIVIGDFQILRFIKQMIPIYHEEIREANRGSSSDEDDSDGEEGEMAHEDSNDEDDVEEVEAGEEEEEEEKLRPFLEKNVQGPTKAKKAKIIERVVSKKVSKKESNLSTSGIKTKKKSTGKSPSKLPLKDNLKISVKNDKSSSKSKDNLRKVRVNSNKLLTKRDKSFKTSKDPNFELEKEDEEFSENESDHNADLEENDFEDREASEEEMENDSEGQDDEDQDFDDEDEGEEETPEEENVEAEENGGNDALGSKDAAARGDEDEGRIRKKMDESSFGHSQDSEGLDPLYIISDNEEEEEEQEVVHLKEKNDKKVPKSRKRKNVD